MRKILIIDDDVGFRDIVGRALRRQGYEVNEAVDGDDGIARAQESLPDLIVCDLNMPGRDGYEVLTTLRADPKLADTPFIFLTGQTAPTEMRHGMNLGADDFLTKPVNLADFLSAVQVRLARRQAQRERQEKQMARGTQLFAEIVHDLRDPLFVMLGYTDLLKGGGSGAAPAGAPNPRQILDRMQQAVHRMQTIISETLFLARSRMQRLPFDPGSFDLRQFCHELVARDDGSARLIFECGPGSFPIVADAVRLRQALENLISNALKYSEGTVTVSLAATPKDYLIEIRDQGIGIPRDERTSVFDPFFRGSNTSEKPGHGLGLSIVKSCVEQHGGRVTFSSIEGKGTTFRVELPKETPAKGSPAAAPAGSIAPPEPRREPGEAGKAAAALGAGGPLQALIVDDDPLVRGLLRDLLEPTVSIMAEAGSVAEARLQAKQHRLDVVFLDVSLPDGSGFELLDDLSPEASVVFVTSAEEYAVNAFDCDAVDFVLKPVTGQRLEKALERVRQRRAGNAPAPAAPSALADSFLVKTLADRRMVKMAEVRRIIAYGEYSWVYWGNDKKGALIRKSLKQWLAELPSDRFIRVHRGAIVNLAHMDRLEKTSGNRMLIHLRDTAEPILVSLRLAPVLNKKLKNLRS
jgi:signal transduction histidine kinase